MDAERRLIHSGSPFEESVGYSRAVVQGPWVWVSGTTGYDYTTMSISEDPAEQAEQALRNIQTALFEAGANMSDVVRVRYLMREAAYAEPCFPVFGKWFKDVRPAATMEVVGLLDENMKLEIEVTAYRPDWV